MIAALVSGGAFFNCIAHFREGRGRLGTQETSGSSRSFIESFEKVRWGREFPDQRKLPHRDIAESAACKHSRAFFAIAEPEKWRARRKLNARIAEILQRAERDAESERLVRFRPGRKPEGSARSQHAMRLAHGGVGLREVQDTEVHHRPVESGVLKIQRFGIADLEFDARM